MKSLSIILLLGTVSALTIGVLFAVTPVLAEAPAETGAQPVSGVSAETDPAAPTTGLVAEQAAAAPQANVAEALYTQETASTVTQETDAQAPQADAAQDPGESLTSAFAASLEKEAAPVAVVAEAAEGQSSQAAAAATDSSTLDRFIEYVSNGKSSQLRGVYVDGVLAATVGQQPGGNASYVSETPNEVTQFALASDYGSLGLLAHNYLAGYSFFNLTAGQTITLVYGDGSTEDYTVQSIHRYQALQPNSTQSQFVDLESGNTLSASNLFYKMYNSSNSLVLQTCIANDGVSTWGRIFIVAVPA